jgi:hypothetical protein
MKQPVYLTSLPGLPNEPYLDCLRTCRMRTMYAGRLVRTAGRPHARSPCHTAIIRTG